MCCSFCFFVGLIACAYIRIKVNVCYVLKDTHEIKFRSCSDVVWYTRCLQCIVNSTEYCDRCSNTYCLVAPLTPRGWRCKYLFFLLNSKKSRFALHKLLTKILQIKKPKKKTNHLCVTAKHLSKRHACMNLHSVLCTVNPFYVLVVSVVIIILMDICQNKKTLNPKVSIILNLLKSDKRMNYAPIFGFFNDISYKHCTLHFVSCVILAWFVLNRFTISQFSRISIRLDL